MLLKASLTSGRTVLCAQFLCSPLLGFVFASFTFGFVKYNIIVYGKYFSQRFRWYNDSLYLLDLSQTEICQTIRILAIRKRLLRSASFTSRIAFANLVVLSRATKHTYANAVRNTLVTMPAEYMPGNVLVTMPAEYTPGKVLVTMPTEYTPGKRSVKRETLKLIQSRMPSN